MAVVNFYPRTWQRYLTAQLNLTEPHGVLLLTPDYTFSAEDKSFSNIPSACIIADINLSDIQYDGANDRFTVADTASTQPVETGLTVGSIVLYSQEDYERDCLLVLHSADVVGLPLVTTGAAIQVSFPDGVLVLAPTGYTTPSIEVAEV